MINPNLLNVPLSLAQVFGLLGVPAQLKSKDSSVLKQLDETVSNVYLGHHHSPSLAEPSRWLTIAAGGAGKDVCIAQGVGDKRSDVEIYNALFASALTSVMLRIARDSPIHEPRAARPLWDFVPKRNPGEITFELVDGEVMPVAPFVEWIRSADDEYHNQYATLLERDFEWLQFMRFPNDAAVAVVGKLKSGAAGYRIPVCVTYHEGINGTLKAIHEMIRVYHKSTTRTNTFDYLTSINPSVDESAR
jgi:hypothetical protein